MSFKLYAKQKLSKFKVVFFIWTIYKEIKLYTVSRKRIITGIKSRKNIIYYCGIPAHGNLGDLAQGVCIRKWLKKHYSSYVVTEIETNALVNTHFSVLKLLSKSFNKKDDFVIFQSGYTTTDLGGYADEMHQAVMKALPNARMLMMPQTIYFQSKEREKTCSEVYNNHTRMLFLARDSVSYEKALSLFPDISVKNYPDIVTTLIGTKKWNNTYQRKGVLFCLRDDGEKYYSDEELGKLIEKCKKAFYVQRTDTTKDKSIVNAAEEYIYSEIEEYSKYRVIVTDRYHGTILSLVAGTPVIILKTTDHKVTTGADWFKGVYDEYVFRADNLAIAYDLISKLYEKDYSNNLEPYFEKEYYDVLPDIFRDLVK